MVAILWGYFSLSVPLISIGCPRGSNEGGAGELPAQSRNSATIRPKHVLHFPVHRVCPDSRVF